MPGDQLAASSKVPDNIKEIHKEFWVCQKCGQAYWQGSQYGNAMQKLSERLDGLKLDVANKSNREARCQLCVHSV